MVRRLISLPFLTMAAWTLTLAWLITEDRYQLFLSPKFELLVYAGAALSLLFALGTADQPVEKTQSHMIKGVFLLLPILFIFSAGDSTLGNFALSKRGMTPVQSASTDDTQAPKTVETPGKTGGGAQADTPVPISKLIRDWQAYENRVISVEGLFSETVVGHDDLSAVFRYFITCCAADAMPVGLFMNRHTLEGLKNDDWVRASGKVRKTTVDGFEVIFMDDAVVEIRPKPSKNAAYIFD